MSAHVVKTETRIREWDANGRLLSERVTTEEDRTPRVVSEVGSERTDAPEGRQPAGFTATTRRSTP